MYEGCTTYKGNNGSREWFGCKLGLKENIYEQFAYFYNLVGYLNSSDISELYDIPPAVKKKEDLKRKGD